MDIERLYEMASEYTEFSCKPKNPKYKVGTIFDEDKSVRWNREEIERLNGIHTEEVKELNRKKNLLLANVEDAIEKYIIEETKVSKKRAEKIYRYLYEEYHSYGIRECICHLDDLLEIFR